MNQAPPLFASHSMQPEQDRFHSIGSLALVVLLSWLAYGLALRNGFAYDDVEVVSQNPGLGSLLSPSVYFTRDYFRLSGETTYRPLVTLSYAIDYRLWGLKPFGYHSSNLLWHCLASVLFFFVCRSLNASKDISTVAAILYAAHPIMSEAVCSIAFREDLLCAAFYFAAFALWPDLSPSSRERSAIPKMPVPSPSTARRHRRSKEPGAAPATKETHDPPLPPFSKGARPLMRGGASVACFVLALLSKEMALSFPLLIFAKDWRSLRHAGRTLSAGLKTLALRQGPLWFVAIAAFVLFQTFSLPVATPDASSAALLPRRIAMFIIISARYLRLLVLPYPLRADYMLSMDIGAFWLSLTGAVAVWAAIGILCFRLRRRFPSGMDSFVAFFLLLTPVSNVVPLLHPMAERYLALPAAAYCWLLAHVLAVIRAPRLRWALMGGLLTGYVILSWARVRDWRSEETLWNREIRLGASSFLPYCNLGAALESRGDFEGAIRCFSEALRIKPGSAQTHYNMGFVLGKRGQSDQAIQHYGEALRIQPDHPKALYCLGVELAGKGRLEEAVQRLLEAVRQRPDYWDARYNLGCALARLGRMDEAVRSFAEALRINPDRREAHLGMAAALEAMGKLDEAVEHYRKGVSIRPEKANGGF